MRRRKKSRYAEYEEYEDLTDEEYVEEVLYNRKRRPKKQKTRRGLAAFLGFLTFILGIAIVFLSLFLLFRVQTINVSGNEHLHNNEIISWLREDKYASNSLYVLWKYNWTTAEKPALIETCKISLEKPWVINVDVKEKKVTGYVEYQEQYLYFDEKGTAVWLTTDRVDGVAYVEGMNLEEAKIKMGAILPVSDADVFDRIVEVSQLFVKYELSADRINCTDGNINLYFAGVEVLLGKSNYEERMAQIKPILEGLEAEYPGQMGTLYLDNYTGTDSAVRFVPSAEAVPEENAEGGAEDTSEEEVFVENTGGEEE